MKDYGSVRLQTVEGTGLHFEARFASGQAATFDSGAAAVGPNPVEHLIGALAACVGIDVIGILRKRRLEVTGYEVVMSGKRAESPPKRFIALELVHRVTGRGITAAAVEEAVRLSEDRYCSVLHTLDPALRRTRRIEIIEG